MPRELETIVLKAMAKEPASRYATAQELADDLRRFLDNKPILASRPNITQRMAKWTRRNRGVATAVVAGLVLAVASLSVAVALVLSAYRRETRQHTEAEKNFLRARKAVDEMLTEVGDQSLKDVPGFQLVRKSLLEKALSFNEEFLQEKNDDPGVQVDLAGSHRRVGEIQAMLGNHSKAGDSYRRAISILESLSRPFKESEGARHELGKTYRRLAMSHYISSQPVASEASFQKAIAEQERIRQRSPDKQVILEELADSLKDHSKVPARLDKRQEAVRTAERASQVYDQLIARGPASSRYRMGLAESLDHEAWILLLEFKPEQARKRLERAVEQAEAVLKSDARSSSARDIKRSVLMHQSIAVHDLGDIEASVSLCREAAALGESLVSEYPGVPGYKDGLARCYQNLAVNLSHWDLADPTEVKSIDRRSIELFDRLARDYPDVPVYRLSHASSMMAWGQYHLGDSPKEQEDTFRSALAILDALVRGSPGNQEALRVQAHAGHIFGQVLCSQGRPSEAVPYLRDSAEQFRKVPRESRIYAGSNDNLADVLRVLTWALCATGSPPVNLKEAKPLAEEAVILSPKNPHCWTALAHIRYRGGRWKETTEAIQRGTAIGFKGGPREWLILAMANGRLGNGREARAFFDKAVAWFAKNKPDHELRSLFAEAGDTLGVMNLPNDPFDPADEPNPQRSNPFA